MKQIKKVQINVSFKPHITEEQLGDMTRYILTHFPVNEIKANITEEKDLCPNCKKELGEFDIEMTYESVPYGSTSASYPVEIGINCQSCGYSERF